MPDVTPSGPEAAVIQKVRRLLTEAPGYVGSAEDFVDHALERAARERRDGATPIPTDTETRESLAIAIDSLRRSLAELSSDDSSTKEPRRADDLANPPRGTA